MRGLWLENQQLSFRADLTRPEPPPGEAVVRVLRAGICNTDLEMVRRYYPFTGILGHEFVGRVEEAEDRVWVGRRVCGEINAVCGECETCRKGRPTHCERRTVLGLRGRNGAFADYLTLPVANLHPVPDGIADDEAVFVEPLAAALEIQQQVPIPPEARVVVIGEGKLGNLIAQTLALTGAEVQVIGRHAHKLALLEGRGIRVGYEADLRPRQADVVVECTGQPSGLALACQAVRPRGTIVLKSTYRGEVTVPLARLVVDEVTLTGSRCGPFRPALDLLARRLVEVRPLIHAHFGLEEGLRAFEEAARPGVMKVLLVVSDS